MGKKKMHLYFVGCLALLSALFIFFSPSNFTTAHFIESVSSTGGIKLTLGNLDLGLTGETNSVTELPAVTLKNGANLQAQKLKNEGTLDGKLAYKITVEGLGGAIPLSVSFMIDGISYDAEANDGKFQFLGGADAPVFLDAGEEIIITPNVKSDILPADNEKMTVTISYLLVQSNATEAAEKMFHDEAQVNIVLTLKTADPNPSPAVWPTDGWQTNTNSKVKFNISELINTHYYGDSAADAGNLTFLDNPTIYLEFSKNSGDLKIKIQELEIPGYGMRIVYDENYAANGRVKIVYTLNEKKDNNLYLIKDVALKLKFAGGNIPLYSGKIKAKKLILNTDKPDGLYNTQYQGEFPIYASNKSRSLNLAYINADYSNDLAQSAKPDINFRNYKMSVVTTEDYLNAEIDYLNNSFGLYTNASHNQTGEAGTAEIRITGNSNEPLVMKRAVKTLRTEKTMIIPDQWVPLSGGVSICASKLQLNLKTTVKAGIEYLVSDESNPPALYFKNAGSNFFGFQLQGNATESNGIKVKDIVYSPDLSIMKVIFSYSAPEGTSYDGFNIDITNGLHAVVNGSYIQYANAIQSYSLSRENEEMVDDAATEAGEIKEMGAGTEKTQENQYQTEVPPATSELAAETTAGLLIE